MLILFAGYFNFIMVTGFPVYTLYILCLYTHYSLHSCVLLNVSVETMNSTAENVINLLQGKSNLLSPYR